MEFFDELDKISHDIEARNKKERKLLHASALEDEKRRLVRIDEYKKEKQIRKKNRMDEYKNETEERRKEFRMRKMDLVSSR